MKNVLSLMKEFMKNDIRFVNVFPAKNACDAYVISKSMCDAGAYIGTKTSKSVDGTMKYGDVVMIDADDVQRVAEVLKRSGWFIVVCKDSLSFSASSMKDKTVIEISNAISPREITWKGKYDYRVVVENDGSISVSRLVNLKLLNDALRIANTLNEIRRKLLVHEVHADGWIRNGEIVVYDVDII